MEDLISKVEEINLSLLGSKSSLCTVQSNAKNEIGTEVQEIRKALHQSSQELEYVNVEVSGLLEDINKHAGKELKNLQPQMKWLESHVGSIVYSLEKAEAKISSAMGGSMAFQSSLMDIEQEIATKRRDLTEAKQESANLKSKALKDKKESLKLIRETEKEIAEKDQSIQTKTDEASTLRSELSIQRSQLDSLNADLEKAQQRARRKKEKAWGGGLMAISGILLAPVTGGASLVLTAGGAGYGTAKAVEYDTVKDHIRDLRSRISTTEARVLEADRRIVELTTEKSSLESRLQRLKSTLKSEEATRSRIQKDIGRADQLTVEIALLQKHAQAESSKVRECVRELGALKSKLHEVATQISKEATQLTIGSSDMATAKGANAAQKRLQERNKKAIESLAEAMSNAQLKIPTLLPTTGTYFLEGKAEKDQAVVSSIAVSKMPRLTAN
ncbi:uncharacterized protein PV09_07593 [Verruconis gallopava]|uniref:Uncharacterized protein n=1 Tax=Verruconis gallopava TaxID=253628 RepID=A0A0D2A243_9PEZI|nr:uncharacterized protein PV09_07593 [Verruconis gallopava]KIW00833.1 hypothetical protein PV09_07593 [Verruconis gallopava]